MTKWTHAGAVYRDPARKAEASELPPPKPGVHYELIEPVGEDDYLAFPSVDATKTARQRWILYRLPRPVVPAPSHTPLPRKHMNESQRCRIMSIYLRPWTLISEHASLHVPYLLDLDVVLSASFAQLQRHKVKKPRLLVPERSMVAAWRDYIHRHIVSKHALRLIRNFVLTQTPDSVEADADDEAEKGKTQLSEVSTPWATPDGIATWLDVAFTASETKRTKHEEVVESTRSTTQRLWGLDDNGAPPLEVSKNGSIGHYSKTGLSHQSAHHTRAADFQAAISGKATLKYGGLTHKNAWDWFRELCRQGSSKDTRKPRAKPNAEQQRVIKRVIDRCLQELEDESGDAEWRSEPLRCLLHGIPGAGKSEVLCWLRLFFENVCGWRHGVEFVYLASQNSMAAVIDGCTFHSYLGIPFMKQDGVVANRKDPRGGEHGISNFFLRYERLRWIFVDECSTIGCEILAAGEDQTRRHIRESHTWAMRSKYEQRCFGGVNVCFAGDLWQFRPIQQTPIYNDPFKGYALSSTQRMLAMFWSDEADAVQELFELTTEHRCKDEWLSFFLKSARHGDMDHELYCFMHGLPTRHAGSWMPKRNNVLCGNATCRGLTKKWEEEVLGSNKRTWQERCTDECALCSTHRLRRCRVLTTLQDKESLDVKFSDAPLIHPWNAPKYHASLVRARSYARRTDRILLWVVCEDTPKHSDYRTLPEEDCCI